MIFEIIVGSLLIPLVITLYVIAFKLAYDSYNDFKKIRKGE